MAKIRSLCVYCSASNTARRDFKEAAAALGAAMAREGIDLVYGGGRVGLMGIVADAVLQGGGKVVGVIPDFLRDREMAHQGVSELIRTRTMHERKMAMAQRAQAFLSLPGGFGTLDETFEIITWKQIGLHDRPILLVNIDGFWNDLIAMAQRQNRDGLVRTEHLSMFTVVDDVEGAMAALRAVPESVCGTLPGLC